MRMHRKNNLEERLLRCTDVAPVMGVPDRNLKRLLENYREYLDLAAIFGNENPVFLELGCGCGGFCIEYARRHPEINLLAVERMSNVIITALENAKKAAGQATETDDDLMKELLERAKTDGTDEKE